MLYVFMGPSGSGKTSIVNRLCEVYGYTTVESYTTRCPRYKGERGHIFISKEQYDTLRNKIAPVYYSGDYYTLTKEQLESCDLVVLEPSAVEDLKKNHIPYKVVYIEISKEERISRMKQRGDNEKKIRQRLEEDGKIFGDTIPRDVTFQNGGLLENVVMGINHYIKRDKAYKAEKEIE